MAKRSDETLYALPETKEIFKGQARLELEQLLTEAHSLTHVEKRLKEIRNRIVELVKGNYGVRLNNNCAIVRFQSGQSRLVKELLIENGVTPQQIEDSTKQGEGYWVCELCKAGEI